MATLDRRLQEGPGKVTINYKSYLSSLSRIQASIQEAWIRCEAITAVQRKGVVSYPHLRKQYTSWIPHLFPLKKACFFLVLRLAQNSFEIFHTRFLDFTLDSSWAVRHFTRCWSNLVRRLPLLIQVARPHVVTTRSLIVMNARDAHTYTICTINDMRGAHGGNVRKGQHFDAPWVGIGGGIVFTNIIM